MQYFRTDHSTPGWDVGNYRVRDDAPGKTPVISPRSRYVGIKGTVPTLHVEECGWLHRRGPQRSFDTEVEPWSLDFDTTLRIEQWLDATFGLRSVVVCPCWATRNAPAARSVA